MFSRIDTCFFTMLLLLYPLSSKFSARTYLYTIWAGSSVWESASFAMRRSWVRPPSGPPAFICRTSCRKVRPHQNKKPSSIPEEGFFILIRTRPDNSDQSTFTTRSSLPSGWKGACAPLAPAPAISQCKPVTRATKDCVGRSCRTPGRNSPG